MSGSTLFPFIPTSNVGFELIITMTSYGLKHVHNPFENNGTTHKHKDEHKSNYV